MFFYKMIEKHYIKIKNILKKLTEIELNRYRSLFLYSNRV